MKPPTVFWIYRAATYVFGWLYRPFVWVRAWRGKEEMPRLAERFGHGAHPRPAGPLVWIHGASVGECMLAHSIKEHLQKARPELSFLFTSGTCTSAKWVQKQGHLHQYLPADTPAATRRFMAHYQPDLGIFIESEIWPNLIHAAKNAGVPLALLNARMNAASRTNWMRHKSLGQYVFQCFAWIAAANAETGKLLRMLSGKPVVNLGNLKVLNDLPVPAADDIARFEQQVKNRPIWLAASTHADDETILLQAHRQVMQAYPNALLILAPRHPKRGAQIAKLANTFNLDSAQHSQTGTIRGPLWIADSIGDMALWLHLCQIVYVGGSFGGGRGHTPLEAILANRPIVSGPRVESFAPIYDELAAINAVQFVQDPAQMAAAIIDQFANPARAKAQIMAAQKWMQRTRNNLADPVVFALLSQLGGDDNAPT